MRRKIRNSQLDLSAAMRTNKDVLYDLPPVTGNIALIREEIRQGVHLPGNHSDIKDTNFHKIPAEGYTPTYVRTDLMDALHEAFGFKTDLEIVPN